MGILADETRHLKKEADAAQTHAVDKMRNFGNLVLTPTEKGYNPTFLEDLIDRNSARSSGTL